MMKRALWILAAILLTALPASAADKKAEEPAAAEGPSIYAPDYCEFAVTFPSAPYKRRECEDESKPDTCYDKISYTQVYELSATVNFRVICNPIGEEVLKNYSGKVMEATLRAMTKDSVVKAYDTSYREEDGYKQAGLVGEGKVGTMPTIYIAQLWIGGHSALSVEAEMIGEANDAADTLFSDILRSIHYTAGPKTDAGQQTDKKSAPEKPDAQAAPDEAKKKKD